MRLALCIALVHLFIATASGQTPSPDAGISLDLAEARAQRVRDLRYSLRLSVPDLTPAPIEGTNTITFELTSPRDPVVIDFAASVQDVKSVAANGVSTPIEWTNGHIVVPAAALTSGENTIVITFTAGGDSLNRNPDFLYALFVPARAHLALPVFDQPSLKARWSLTLSVPANWQAVSNAAELDRVVDGDRATMRFAETEPLPPYLFSFVVGDFKVETAVRNGRTLRMFHRETDAQKVARNRDAVFDLHASAIEYMERYTGIPYAFGKFDFVLIPAFQFGGMEHAGKILYNAQRLLLDESATQNQHFDRASFIAHETAHMWFGDLVTMQWFDDVWMKEVFANFMAAKIVNPSFPDVNHDLRFLLSNYPAAYEVDRTLGANAIRQQLANLNEAGTLYGPIIYQKAPIIMRHLERLLGDDVLRDGLREYLTTYAFGNATWSDLIAILDERTPMDLDEWSRVWVEEPGRPTIRTEIAVKDGRIAKLAFHQAPEHEELQTKPSRWPQELRIALGYPDSVRELTVDLNGTSVAAPAAVGLPAPLYVLPAGGGWAYGAFALDETSLAYLTADLPAIPDALTRGAAWVTLWDALLDGRVTPAAFVELATTALPRETDEQLTSLVLGYLGSDWWRYLTPDERQARAASIERVLRAGLANATTTSRKASWFSALRTLFSTEETTSWMRRVWAQEEEIDGLPLAEPDYTALALELAVREVDGWRDVLATQLARIENPDRKAQFQFIAPALSADASERERWFNSLGDVNNRRREPWVLRGLAYLHHPLRAGASAQYVRPSLELLWEIQQTGDIFFPTGWMNTTLSGHTSQEVAATVREFLKTLPSNYPPRLRNTILVAADDVFRVTRERSPRARAARDPSN